MRISEGRLEIGQGGDGDASVGACVGVIEMEEKEAMRSDIEDVGGPSRE